MHISALEKGTLQEMRTYLQLRDESSCAVFDRLEQDGETDPSLCFLASEGGAVKGALAVCRAYSEDTELAVAAVLCAEDDTAAVFLLTQAGAVLRERGVPYFFAVGSQEKFKDWKGSRWMVNLGFVPPALNEESLRFFGVCLDPAVLPTNKPVVFPKAMGLPVPECRFCGYNRMNVEQSCRALIKTRERRRIGECAALGIFAAAVLVIGIWRRELFAIPAAALAAAGMARKLILPRRMAAQLAESFKKRGKEASDDTVFFGEDGFIAFYDRRGRAVYHYSNIVMIYVKRDYLFICHKVGSDAAYGIYIENSSLPDRQALLGFLRSKNPLIEFKK